NSVRRPRLARLMLASMAWSTRLMPALTLRGFVRSIGASDRHFFEAEGPSSMRPFAEGYRQGTRAGLADFRLWRQQWGFRLDEICVPVHLWHGDDDTFIGIDHSQHMAASIPGSSLHIVPDTGHFSDRKSTRLNSSHVSISYAVFCLKKKITRISRYLGNN